MQCACCSVNKVLVCNDVFLIESELHYIEAVRFSACIPLGIEPMLQEFKCLPSDSLTVLSLLQ